MHQSAVGNPQLHAIRNGGEGHKIQTLPQPGGGGQMILKNPYPENPRSAEPSSCKISPGDMGIYKISPVIFSTFFIGKMMIENENRHSRLPGDLLGLPALGAAIHHHQEVAPPLDDTSHHIVVKPIALTMTIRNKVAHRRPQREAELHRQSRGGNPIHVVITINHHPRMLPQGAKKILP
jgi:hypothetical protein